MFSMILGSVLPFMAKGIKTWSDSSQDKRDKAHELALSAQEWEFRREIETEKTQQAALDNLGSYVSDMTDFSIQTSKATGITWVDAIVSLVRPITTFVYVGLHFYVLYIGVNFLRDSEQLNPETVIQLWEVMCAEIFTFIISYWFGERGARRIFDKKLT